MKKYLLIIALFFTTVVMAQPTTADVWINEFHYDGITSYGEADINEFVEIAIKNTIATDAVELAKYRLILYTSGAYDSIAWNAGKGLPYNVSSLWFSEAQTIHQLTGFTACPVTGTAFTLLSKAIPNLQDVPAAFALVYDNTVIQLLSYEKPFKIASSAQGGGPAAGMTTSLITNQLGNPAMEIATTLNNHSVSLLGTGTEYDNFYWDDEPIVMATPCAPNTNGLVVQDFSGPLPVRWLSLTARGTKQTIFVDWNVATETGVSKYVVEIMDERGSMVTTMDMPYNRNANGHYQANIPGMKTGTYRVRIKSQMLSGDVEYSATRLVKLSDRSGQFVSVFPNPVKNGVAGITIIPTEKTSYTIEVVDMNGKRISSMKTAVLQANTLNRLEVPLPLSPGIYQLKVISQNEQQTIKVVVM